MRIVSHFKDYYDCTQAYGFDPHCIWIRNKKEIEVHRSSKAIESVFNLCYTYGHVGFCGNIYLYYRKGDTYLYSFEALDAHIRSRLAPKQLEAYASNTTRMAHKYRWGITHKIARNRWNKLAESNLNKFFEKYHTPVFHVERRRLVLNADLKSLEFQKLFDPFTAYQEISNYYCGVLGGPKEQIPPVSNEDLIEAKGFDLKHSFRKEKK